jgi:hypothetical protein
MAQRKAIDWQTLNTHFGPCSWALIDGHIHVRSSIGNRSAKMATMPPESVAALLMFQLHDKEPCCG